MKKITKIIFAAAIFLCLNTPTAQAADASCLLDGVGQKEADMSNCPTRSSVNGDTTNAAAGYIGARFAANHIATTPVDAHNSCRYIDNKTSNDYFAPFKTPQEWTDFRHYPPTGVTLRHCARTYSGSDIFYGPTDAIGSDEGERTHAYENLPLPYWPTGVAWPTTVTPTHAFTNICHYQISTTSPTCRDWVPNTCTNTTCNQNNVCFSSSYDCSYCRRQGTVCQDTTSSWSQTFNLLFSALDSDTASPSWGWTSTKTAGPARPGVCNTTCTDNGLDCVCNGVTPSDPENKQPTGTTTTITTTWTDWSACSASCGGGQQARTCQGSDGKAYDASFCSGLASQTCNTASCTSSSDACVGGACLPVGATVNFSCLLSAGYDQYVTVLMANGTQSVYALGHGEGAQVALSTSFASVPVRIYVTHNGLTAYNAYYTVNNSPTSYTIYTEDGGDGDYNDAVCTLSW